MTIASILAVLVFSTVLSIIEIPKMVKQKLNRELWTFSILLGLGTLLTILKSLGFMIPNPSDFVAWVYSPISEVMKSMIK